ncbi:MAG: hypothetical protein IJP81_03775 [Bacteroidales bacterium]|nr:hypothetical protein [Bacteroidales bacterium]
MDRKLLYACPRADVFLLQTETIICGTQDTRSLKYGSSAGAIDILEGDVNNYDDDF